MGYVLTSIGKILYMISPIADWMGYVLTSQLLCGMVQVIRFGVTPFVGSLFIEEKQTSLQLAGCGSLAIGSVFFFWFGPIWRGHVATDSDFYTPEVKLYYACGLIYWICGLAFYHSKLELISPRVYALFLTSLGGTTSALARLNNAALGTLPSPLTGTDW